MKLSRESDTLVAPATPPGRGGVAVIRLSGAEALTIAERIAGALPPAREARMRPFTGPDGARIDDGLVIVFPEPGSYTGENVVELHCHGGPMVVELLVEACVAAGARMAEPGEFSRRAFLNDRLDLAQAEAVADLIDSGSRQAAAAALASLRGAFSARTRELAEALTALRAWVEAALDFPEDEVDYLADESVARQVKELLAAFDELAETARQGRLLRDGMTVVIAGRPNAGKSSLLNQLTGEASAIVTHLPGTTRDILRQQIQIDGMPLHVVDTAGLRDSADLVEREGVRRARAEIARADRVLLVTDASDAAGEPAAMELPADVPVTVVRNKIDLTGEAAGAAGDTDATPVIRLSAVTGAGVDALRAHLKASMGFHPEAGGALSARRRHLVALAAAREHVAAARDHLVIGRAGELMAEELRLAQERLGEITGEVSTEDLLGRIFSSFCIGK
jgi:tRNA modification GTPase